MPPGDSLDRAKCAERDFLPRSLRRKVPASTILFAARESLRIPSRPRGAVPRNVATADGKGRLRDAIRKFALVSLGPFGRGTGTGAGAKHERAVPVRQPEEVRFVPIVVAILLALGAGLLVGSRVHTAREARSTYSSYRARTAKGFGEWIRSTFNAVLAVAGAAVLLMVILSAVPHG